ncbi:MAG: hypothetical protein OXR84_16930 [Magnetovibrio sp.]|nr:hypothetical protein [Magnetovibrio sp.]
MADIRTQATWKSLAKPLAVAAFVVAVMAPDGRLSLTLAQSVGPSGCVKFCNGQPGSSGGGGGAGCAGPSGGAYHGSTTHSYNPQASSHFNNQGVAAYRRGDYREAAGLFEHAVESNSGNQTARRNLGDAYQQLGRQAARQGNEAGALSYYEKALKYKDTGDLRDSVATLRRRLGGSGKSCGLCGKALHSDVTYGYNSSASLMTYIVQSENNYLNCTNGFLASCKQSCGYALKTGLWRCKRSFHSSPSGYKGCVGQYLSQTC